MNIFNMFTCYFKLIKEVKDQELIQSSSTPGPGQRVGKRQKHKKTSQRS